MPNLFSRTNCPPSSAASSGEHTTASGQSNASRLTLGQKARALWQRVKSTPSAIKTRWETSCRQMRGCFPRCNRLPSVIVTSGVVADTQSVVAEEGRVIGTFKSALPDSGLSYGEEEEKAPIDELPDSGEWTPFDGKIPRTISGFNGANTKLDNAKERLELSPDKWPENTNDKITYWAEAVDLYVKELSAIYNKPEKEGALESGNDGLHLINLISKSVLNTDIEDSGHTFNFFTLFNDSFEKFNNFVTGGNYSGARGILRLIKEGIDQIVANPENQSALIEGVNRQISGNSFRTNLSEYGEKYVWENSETIDELLEKVIDNLDYLSDRHSEIKLSDAKTKGESSESLPGQELGEQLEAFLETGSLKDLVNRKIRDSNVKADASICDEFFNATQTALSAIVEQVKDQNFLLAKTKADNLSSKIPLQAELVKAKAALGQYREINKEFVEENSKLKIALSRANDENKIPKRDAASLQLEIKKLNEELAGVNEEIITLKGALAQAKSGEPIGREIQVGNKEDETDDAGEHSKLSTRKPKPPAITDALLKTIVLKANDLEKSTPSENVAEKQRGNNDQRPKIDLEELLNAKEDLKKTESQDEPVLSCEGLLSRAGELVNILNLSGQSQLVKDRINSLIGLLKKLQNEKNELDSELVDLRVDILAIDINNFNLSWVKSVRSFFKEMGLKLSPILGLANREVLEMTLGGNSGQIIDQSIAAKYCKLLLDCRDYINSVKGELEEANEKFNKHQPFELDQEFESVNLQAEVVIISFIQSGCFGVDEVNSIRSSLEALFKNYQLHKDVNLDDWVENNLIAPFTGRIQARYGNELEADIAAFKGSVLLIIADFKTKISDIVNLVDVSIARPESHDAESISGEIQKLEDDLVLVKNSWFADNNEVDLKSVKTKAKDKLNELEKEISLIQRRPAAFENDNASELKQRLDFLKKQVDLLGSDIEFSLPSNLDGIKNNLNALFKSLILSGFFGKDFIEEIKTIIAKAIDDFSGTGNSRVMQADEEGWAPIIKAHVFDRVVDHDYGKIEWDEEETLVIQVINQIVTQVNTDFVTFFANSQTSENAASIAREL